MQDAHDRPNRTYDGHIPTAERMARAGAAFDQVEEYIDGLELGDQDKRPAVRAGARRVRIRGRPSSGPSAG